MRKWTSENGRAGSKTPSPLVAGDIPRRLALHTERSIKERFNNKQARLTFSWFGRVRSYGSLNRGRQETRDLTDTRQPDFAKPWRGREEI